MGEEAGWRRDTDPRPAMRGPEAAAQQVRRGGQLGGKRGGRQEGGRSRGQKRREDGEEGRAASLYIGKTARPRQPRSGGAKPEEAAHRHLDYNPQFCISHSSTNWRCNWMKYG
jgi:hypothetical protein